jgi:3-oxoacid CoA-transferase
LDKVVSSAAEAVADIPDGACIAVSGFGLSSGVPNTVLAAAVEHGARDLCLVANSLSRAAAKLVENDQVSRLIVSFLERPNIESAAAVKAAEGAIHYEMVPQGTLVERLRAGGAGLAGIYTPTGVGTPIAVSKEVRFFDGKPFVFEPAIRVDYALVTAYRADRIGNCEFRGSSQHFNPSFAKAARIAIVEVEEIVEPGEIDPHRVGLPGCFVSRVVKRTVPPDRGGVERYRRAPDTARTYFGKPAWTRSQIAQKAATLLPEPSYVNLGLGLPTLVANYLAGRDITLHGENGILGYGRAVDADAIDYYVHDAGSNYVAPLPGVAYFDSVTAFEMVRGGRIDVVVIGAYQVDEGGSVANWSTPDLIGGGIGGAMDLVAGGRTVMVLMEHRDSRDRPKLVRSCTYPLTGVNCVDVVVTDLAVLRRTNGQFHIEEVAPGFTLEEVSSLAEMQLALPTIGG